MNFLPEDYSDDERKILERYFTNIDGPVFALTNLPEVVKAALFARYSRTSKSLKRLFLDEFYDELGDTVGTGASDVGLRRAEKLFERVISDYGDDSVAQLGGVHLACEQSSNLLTKVLERGRLLSYLEQSTRYLNYGARRRDGTYAYRIPPEIEGEARDVFISSADGLFDAYNALYDKVFQHLLVGAASSGTDEDRRSARAAAFDSVRGLLPAGTLSNLGIFGSPQGFEALIMRMRASTSMEVLEYGELIRAELEKVVPSFLTRLDRPDRGGEWVRYLRDRAATTTSTIGALRMPGEGTGVEQAFPAVRLVNYDPNGEERILEGIAFEGGCSSDEAHQLVSTLSPPQRSELIATYVGNRGNRRHKPGRAFELTNYTFEILCDYGAFRDLQRHRMLTVQWHGLGVDLGFAIPELIVSSRLSEEYMERMEVTAAEVRRLSASLGSEVAAYLIPMGFNIRFRFTLNAREAMHLIELRSQASGHTAYREVAQTMHREIAVSAGHRLVAGAMSYVDHATYLLGRREDESRRRAKLDVWSQRTH